MAVGAACDIAAGPALAALPMRRAGGILGRSLARTGNTPGPRRVFHRSRSAEPIFIGSKQMPFIRKAGLALAAWVAFSVAATAQDYPTRSVKMIVPFGAGGPADVFARVLAQHMGDSLKQSFIVENRPGAGAVIGTTEVAKSAPDGYTLLVMSNTHTTNESLNPKRGYELMRDFVPVSPINYSDLLMVAHPSTGVKNLKDFIAMAKAKPGQLNYASSGPGTPYHMAGELFKAMSGTDIVHVPHKTSGDMRTSVLGGHVQMMFDAITVMADGVRSGKLVALGTTGKQRSAVMPDAPTVAEAGVPDYEATIWLGVMAPAGTPKAIVDKLNAEIAKVMNRADVKEAWAKQGAVPMPMSTADFDKYLRADIDKWAHVVKVSGAKLE
jgi:tripartite-type tricarboxylate transporter receptor subunit TctC